jgi:hypothetical protein
MKKNIGIWFTSDELKELNEYAKILGNSRSGLCSNWIKRCMEICQIKGVFHLQQLLAKEADIIGSGNPLEQD